MGLLWFVWYSSFLSESPSKYFEFKRFGQSCEVNQTNVIVIFFILLSNFARHMNLSPSVAVTTLVTS